MNRQVGISLRRRVPIALAAALLLASAAVVVAQDAPARADLAAGIVPTVEGGKRIYTVAQFTRFAPQTTLDVVQQIPGFSISVVSNERGIGEASQNVLINGQRITGKGNDAQAVLRRTSVSSVIRLEIVDGATLDISGLSGDVLNVITEPDSVQGNYAWRPQFREDVGNMWPAGEVNVSGKAGIGEFALGLRWDGFRGGGWATQTEYRQATDLTTLRDQDLRFANDQPRLTGSLTRRMMSGNIWNLNGSLERQHFTRHVVTQFQVPGEPFTTEESRGDNVKWRTEIGSDYEFALGSGRLKLVGLYTDRRGPNVNEFASRDDGDPFPAGSRFTRDSTEGERVLRTEYRWRDLGSDWSISAEGAQNFVDAEGDLRVLDSSGEYQPVLVPGASSRVEELRGETVLSFSRTLSRQWSLQTSGGVEYSRLSQDGDTSRQRHFWRPKGAVILAWNPSRWEFDLKLQRKVGQLDFFDFLALVDVANNNSNGSNTELVPPQSWLAELQVVRNLGAHGNVKLSIEGEDISDIVDQVPIDATTEAPGNLPKATSLEFSLDTSLLLDGIGIPGGKLDTLLRVTDTRVRDPLFGTYRESDGNRYYWNVDFRQDIPGTPWTWGLFAEVQSTNHTYRLDSEEHFTGANPFGSVFLEHKDLWGLKVRVTVANLLNQSERTRQVSYVDRRDGPVDYTRDAPLEFGRIYRLQVSGTF
jgi:outer membrane receptor for ferrienterochelin and colicins